MYLEFLILISDYFQTLNRRLFIFEWLIPALFVISLYFLNRNMGLIPFKVFKENALDILGILLGFSIAIITIITTGSGKNLDEIKNKTTQFTTNNKAVTLYELLLINFTYSVIVEIFIIIGCLTVPLISGFFQLTINCKLILYLLLVFGIIHILLLTMRNLTDFYFIITKK